MTTNEFFHRFVDRAMAIVGQETCSFFLKLEEIGHERLEEASNRYYDWISETPECVKEKLEKANLFYKLSFDDYMEYQDQYKFDHYVSLTTAIEDKVKPRTDIISSWKQISYILQETLPDCWLYYALLEFWIIKDIDLIEANPNYSPIFLRFLGDDFMK